LENFLEVKKQPNLNFSLKDDPCYPCTLHVSPSRHRRGFDQPLSQTVLDIEAKPEWAAVICGRFIPWVELLANAIEGGEDQVNIEENDQNHARPWSLWLSLSV
jgi:hypothetical protein